MSTKFFSKQANYITNRMISISFLLQPNTTFVERGGARGKTANTCKLSPHTPYRYKKRAVHKYRPKSHIFFQSEVIFDVPC